MQYWLRSPVCEPCANNQSNKNGEGKYFFDEAHVGGNKRVFQDATIIYRKLVYGKSETLLPTTTTSDTQYLYEQRKKSE